MYRVIEDVDYSSGPYSVLFTAGVTTVSFDVPIRNNNVSEGNKDFSITIDPLSLPSGVSVGDPGEATVTIVDDDGK